MTDQELLDLLALKTPEDLSLEEIDQLRQRLVEATPLRKLLLNELQMGTYFEDAFARIGTTLAQVEAEAAQREKIPRQPIWPAAVYVLAVLTLTYGGGMWFSYVRSATPATLAQLPAESEKASLPSEVTPTETKETSAEPAADPTSEPSAPAANPETPPAADPVPADPNAGKPWEAVFKQPGPLPTFRESALLEFDREKHILRANELRPWLAAVPGMEGRLVDDEVNRLKLAKFSGHQRLVCPWQADSAVKFWLDSYNKFQIHFFRGEQGVTLAFHEEQGSRWFAYTTTRKPGQVRPEEWALTASDFYRTWRCQMYFGGSYELRCTGEEIILTRGDVVLLRAPFAGMPDDVYLDGTALVYGMKIIRTQDLPAVEPPPPLVFDTDKPAELPWKLRSDKGPAIERLPDGSVRFATAIPLAERAEISTPLPHEGMHEVIFQIADATAGAGVFLGRKDGLSHEVVRFMANPRLKQLQLAGRMGWDDQAEGEGRWPKEQPTAAAQANTWVKLVFGLGSLTWHLSSDGEHWGSCDNPIDYLPGNVTSVGLQLVAQRPNVGLTLKRLQLRELTGLTSLANADELQRAYAAPQAPFIGMWYMEIAAHRPADIAWSDWERICAVKTLRAGATRSVAYPLVDILLDDAVERKLPPQRILAALADVAQMGIDYKDRQSLQTGLVRRYWDLALQSENSIDDIWRHWQNVPLNVVYIDNPPYETLVRKELFGRLYAPTLGETQPFVQRAKFFHLDQQVPLLRWADYVSKRDTPSRSGPDATSVVIREGWPHPLIEDVSKETYNVTSELRAVLESDALEDAARMLSRLDLSQFQGLTPAVDDKSLFVSATNSIQAALLKQPRLEELLAERYDKIARLRFEEALTTGDAAIMENLALQFHATEAGAEAHKWLGDRALAEGRLELALAEYRRAREHATAAVNREMQPQQQLASAMLGQDPGPRLDREVVFGNTRFSAEQFEALLKEMRERKQIGVIGTAISAGEPARGSAPPTGLKAERRGAFDGPNGDRHTEEGARHVNHYKLPWVDRQLAVVVDQDTLLVSNRFQLSAFDLNNGQRKWQSQPIPGLKTRKAQESAMIAARPLVLANRVIVRQLYGDGFLLAAFQKEDGKLLWSLPFKEPEQLISDPFWLDGSLIAFTGWKDGQNFVVRWSVIDPETGAIEQQVDVLQLKQSWLRRPSLEFTLVEDGVIVQGAGCVLHLDAHGTTRWLRKFIWTPEEEDSRAVVQAFQKPIVANGLLYVTQPGVRCVTCLDLATGWQRWTRVLPELSGILGLVETRLIVQQETELLALNAADGSIVWRQPLGEVHPTWLCGPEWLVAVERQKLDPTKELRTNRVVWRDTKTGLPVAAARLPGFDDDDPRFGLLIPHRDRLWTFAGKSQSDANRTLVELSPQGEPEPVVRERAPIWVRALDPKFNINPKPFPPFILAHALPGDKAGKLPDIYGEKDVIGTRAWGDKPTGWLYVGKLPPQTSKLLLKIGVDDGVAWKLRVTLNDRKLAEEEFKPPHKDRWMQREISLSEFQGQDVALVVSAFPLDGVERVLYWKQVRLEQ